MTTPRRTEVGVSMFMFTVVTVAMEVDSPPSSLLNTCPFSRTCRRLRQRRGAREVGGLHDQDVRRQPARDERNQTSPPAEGAVCRGEVNTQRSWRVCE